MLTETTSVSLQCVSLCLPHSEFRWVEDLSVFISGFILGLEEEGDTGYTLEVHLNYPSHLHHRTADLPLAPESGEITQDAFRIHGNLTSNTQSKQKIHSLSQTPSHTVQQRTLRCEL